MRHSGSATAGDFSAARFWASLSCLSGREMIDGATERVQVQFVRKSSRFVTATGATRQLARHVERFIRHRRKTEEKLLQDTSHRTQCK